MKTLDYKKTVRVSDRITTPEAVEYVATEKFGDNWIMNPARDLYPFFLGRDKTTGKKIVKYRVIRVGRDKTEVKTRKHDVKAYRKKDIRSFNHLQKHAKRFILDAVNSGGLEGKISLIYGSELKVNKATNANLIRAQYLTVFCTGYLRFEKDGKKQVGLLTFNKADLEKFVRDGKKWNVAEFQSATSHDKKRFKLFVKEILIPHIKKKFGVEQDCWPVFTKQQAVDFAAHVRSGEEKSTVERASLGNRPEPSNDADKPEKKMSYAQYLSIARPIFLEHGLMADQSRRRKVQAERANEIMKLLAIGPALSERD